MPPCRRQYRRADGHVQAGAAHHARIDRPALAALLPTLGNTDCVMLDLGANTECDAQNLVQFAVMGSAYSRTVLGIAKPRVKLLNIGTEEPGHRRAQGRPRCCARRPICRCVRGLHRGRPAQPRRHRRGRDRRLFGNIALKTAEGRRASSPTCCAAHSPRRSGPRPVSRCRGRR